MVKRTWLLNTPQAPWGPSARSRRRSPWRSSTTLISAKILSTLPRLSPPADFSATTRVVDHFGGRQDLAQAGFKALVAAQGGEIHRHADLELADVGLGDLGLHRHARQVGDLHDH